VQYDLKFDNILNSMGMDRIMADLDSLDISDFGEDDEYDEETKTETSIDTTKKRR